MRNKRSSMQKYIFEEFPDSDNPVMFTIMFFCINCSFLKSDIQTKYLLYILYT